MNLEESILELSEFFRRSEETKPRSEGIPKPVIVTVEERHFETKTFTPADSSEIKSSQKQTLGPPKPTVSEVSPATISTEGGTAMTITGANFRAGEKLAVAFGGYLCTSVTFISATKLTCVSPSHGVGVVDVDMTNGDGLEATSLIGKLLYQMRPHVTSISPNTGPITGGGTITLTGFNFMPFNGAPHVLFVQFDNEPILSAAILSDTQATVGLPSHNKQETVKVEVANRFQLKDLVLNGFSYGAATPPPPPPGSSPGGTLIGPTWRGDQYGMAINTNWPMSVTSTATTSIKLIVLGASYTLFGPPGSSSVVTGTPTITITPNTGNPPFGVNIVFGCPFPPYLGSVAGYLDLGFVDPSTNAWLPINGNSHTSPFRYTLNPIYP